MNLNMLAHAQKYYESEGFKEIEVPWIVSQDADDSCRPPDREPIRVLCNSIRHRGSRLPGSGEQGFVQMMLDGNLPPGKYQTFTPCFRDEAVIDLTHQSCFLKLELIIIWGGEKHAPTDRRPAGIMNVARDFMSRWGVETRLIHHDGEIDLVADAMFGEPLELGSYGTRSWKGNMWTYGTGLAEPRFSLARGWRDLR